jgi:predicted membrane protein
MQLSFNYSEPHLIEHQLYIASRSPKVIKSRIRNRLLLTIIYAIIGIIGLMQANFVFGSVFIAVAILWYMVYPYWGGNLYKKNFTRFVQSANKNRFGNKVDVIFEEHQIVLKEQGEEVAFDYTEFNEIAELPQTFLIKLSTNMVIVIQKNATIPSEEIAAFLLQLATKLNIDYVDELAWEWR